MKLVFHFDSVRPVWLLFLVCFFLKLFSTFTVISIKPILFFLEGGKELDIGSIELQRTVFIWVKCVST